VVQVIPIEGVIQNYVVQTKLDEGLKEEQDENIQKLEKQRQKLLKQAAYPRVSLNSSLYQGACNLTCSQECFANSLLQNTLVTFLECIVPQCRCVEFAEKIKNKTEMQQTNLTRLGLNLDA
jgi:hypothetical protein